MTGPAPGPHLGRVSALDTDFVAQLLEDLEPEDFGLVVDVFGRDLRQLSAALAAAAEAGDRTGFARRAHKLAGAAAAVGARPLAGRARRLSEPRGDEDLRVALGEIRVLGQEAEAALAALLPPRRPAPR